MAFFGIYLRFLGCIVLISHMAQSYHTRSFLGKALPSPTWIAWGAPERGFRPTPSISVLLPSCLDSPSWTFPFTFRSDNSHFPPKNKNNGTTVIQWSFLVPSIGGKWYLYIYRYNHPIGNIPVVPGQAGGGSFQKEKNYIAQKEFAYRMCARRPTSAMPKSFLCCERAFCRSVVVMFCALKWSVLISWCLLRGQVMWWSRHLMRCDGLCCVMSRDAMRCHGGELYYSSTTPYYKVLLKYYKVHSSTTLYYKVLLQY